jgi:hypothetical protein
MHVHMSIEDPLAIYARPGLSHEEIEELKEAFDLFDTDSSGYYFDQPTKSIDHSLIGVCTMDDNRYY